MFLPGSKSPFNLLWPFLYRRRKSSLQKTERELFIGQLISVGGAVVAGVILESTKGTIVATVGILLILPGIFDLGGSVAGAFGARVSHHANSSKSYWHSLIRALAITAAGSVVLGAIGGTIGWWVFQANFYQLLSICFAATTLTALVGLPLVGGLTLAAKKFGWDPDNFIGPLETSIFDSLSILAVVVLLRLGV